MVVGLYLAVPAVGSDCVQSPVGLIGWWPGDGNAQDIADTNHGTLLGGATADAPGVVGAAFRFDGTNGYVQIPDAPVLRPTNLTVECWVLFTSLNSAGNTPLPGQQYMVFRQNSRSYCFEGFMLSKDRVPQGDVFLWEVTSAAGQLVRVDSRTTISTNVWYHVAGVRGSNYLALYVNGVLETNAPVDFPQDYGNWPLYFGTSGQSYYDRKLHGWLDEVALYNRALSSNEIAAIYAAGSAGRCKAPEIRLQPVGGTRYWGSSITLTSSAVGVTPLIHQWHKDDAPVSGATNAWLSLTNLQLTDAGTYTLRVTNRLGATSSSPALLQMKLADLSLRVQTPHIAELTLAGVPGQTYGIRYASELSLTNWLGLTNLLLTAPTQTWKDPQPATLPQRYYRVVEGPIPIP